MQKREQRALPLGFVSTSSSTSRSDRAEGSIFYSSTCTTIQYTACSRTQGLVCVLWISRSSANPIAFAIRDQVREESVSARARDRHAVALLSGPPLCKRKTSGPPSLRYRGKGHASTPARVDSHTRLMCTQSGLSMSCGCCAATAAPGFTCKVRNEDATLASFASCST